MTLFRLLQALWIFLLFSLNPDATTTHAAEQECNGEGLCEELNINTNEQVEDVLQNLISWVRDQGGFVHPSLGVGYQLKPDYEQAKNEDGDFPSYSFGLYVKKNETIAKGEQILFFPQQVVINVPRKGDYDSENVCLLADHLSSEVYKHTHKNSSKVGPYVDFLLKFALYEANLPATWSDLAKDILGELIEDVDFASFSEYYRCFQFNVWEEEFENDREDMEDLNDVEYKEGLVEIALSRGRDSNLVPIYDIINHSNDPDQINIALTGRIDSGRGFGVEATRDLLPGEEIKYSYGLGTPKYDHEFGFMDYGMGTIDLLQIYGFVEGYPQRWHFATYDVDFSIRKNEENGELELSWRSGRSPDDDAVYFFQQEVHHFEMIREEILEWEATIIPGDELRLIEEFMSAHGTALQLAIEMYTRDRDPNESEYVVQEETVILNSLDTRLFQQYQCNTLIQRVFDREFETLEFMRSAYQKITYYRDPKTNDVCLYLDGVYQQCTSYWPHYHELVVHKPAKYLKEDLKRVLWVGGGDSGPLNEILKYPNLELAVGLELDQQVTRLAFKHFPSQPHFDNPKVQWWYGDASKSLLMLPKEYFGSFDLVIVDLSDTVFSLSVSAELDVIEAISLLLRPGGIFEMNELFLRKVSKVFEYAVHYQFTDVPKICDQAAIFASNDVDFMFQDITDHKLVENATLLVEQDSMKSKHQFDRIHDYRRNPNPGFKKLCKKMEEGGKDVKPQTEAPGIMMIVEAENLSADLSSPKVIRNAIADEIGGLGLSLVPEKSESTLSSRFVIMMKEGYVIARLYPDVKYCALDIHLWSAFEKHDALKEAIVVKALGGSMTNKSTSAYRIVAGGMFGLSNWKETSETHGPQISQVCSDEEVPKRNLPSGISIYKQALEMSLEVVQGKDLTAAVICGDKTRACPTIELLESHPKFQLVVPVYECSKVEGGEWDEQEECAIKSARKDLDKMLPQETDLVHVIVIDLNTTIDAARILGVLETDNHFAENDVFLIATTDSKQEIWRRRVVDHIRAEIEMDPLFRAQVLFNTTRSSLELSITASGDPIFLEHLTNAVSSSQEKTPDVTVEIRNIIGGHWREEKKHMCADWEFSQVTVAEDYNHDDARSQWKSQTPLATQALLQFSNIVDGSPAIPQLADITSACETVFSTRTESSMVVYDDIEGNGAICAGSWESGSAVVSWDGRFQVDLNIFSINGLAGLAAFEDDLKSQLPTLGGWLRDIQPRGYGRVVNFKEDKEGRANFFE